MLSVQCPKCGSTNIFDETKQVPTYCAFCAAHLPDMTTFVKESLKLGLDKQYHAMELERMDKEIKKERVDTSLDKLKIIAIIVLGVIIFGYLFFVLFRSH